MFQRTKICSGLLIAFGGIYATTPALAQDTSVQRVEITGSSIKRIDAETSVPVTVLKADDLKKQGVTSVEQILQNISSVQVQTGTSQVVGSGSAGASFADLRGIGANKTLILLNGRRVANNAFDSSAPDMNMIPFAAIERVEVLRDGASSLYGTDAIGGVINFITRKDYRGGTITLGADKPQKPGGGSHSANIGFGAGDLQKDGVNLFGFVDFSNTARIGGTERPFNQRLVGGLSPTPFPANYFQTVSANPNNPACDTPGLTPNPKPGKLDCYETTSGFVNYTPSIERISGLMKGAFKLTENHTLGLEGFLSHSETQSVIAPVPYGGLYMNPTRPDGSPNPYYPGNPGSGFTPSVTLDPNYTEPGMPAGVLPGFVHIRWRDLASGQRTDTAHNDQSRFVANLEGVLADWDYNVAGTYNTNTVKDYLSGYSDGGLISQGMMNGVLNPFGAQDAAGTALINQSAVAGNLQNAKGEVTSFDGHASRDLGDWFKAGRPTALAIGAEYRHEKYVQAANHDFAQKVIASTGLDPNTYNAGDRDVYAAFAELEMPVIKSLDFTFAGRFDKYSDFGNTFNPKVGFRFQPVKSFVMRGSYSTGFRAPSLYELHSSPTFTNTAGPQNDPVTCPTGTAIPPHADVNNCGVQFLVLNGGELNLKPEKAKNATLGLVFEPVQDFTGEIDLWAIKTSHQIGLLVADDLFAVDNLAKYGDLYHRNANGEIASDGSQCPTTPPEALAPTCGYVDNRYLNLGETNTNGIDFAVGYHVNAGAAGKLNFGLQSTWVHKYEYQNEENGPFFQNVGTFSGAGPIFRWTHNAEANWNFEPFSLGLAGHFKTGYWDQKEVPTGALDANGDPITAPRHVSDYATFDLFGTYAMQKGFTVTLGVKNLFDRDPPFSNQTITFQAGYDPRFTDPTGRTFYARGTYSF
jgi:iron complex outermembrane receptor protein